MEVFDLRPYSIETRLKLRNPIYYETSSYGHMGRKNEIIEKNFKLNETESINLKAELFTWEKTDCVNELSQIFKV